MPYVGEARFRFDGDRKECSRYISLARVLVERTAAMYDIGAAGADAATQTKVLPNGVTIKVTVFTQAPPIITITVPEGAKKEEEEPEYEWPLTLVGTTQAGGDLGAAGIWTNAKWQYVSDEDTLSPSILHIDWKRFGSAKYADKPCGEITWFPPPMDPDSGTGAREFVVSWTGPTRRTFSNFWQTQRPALTGYYVWVSYYDKTKMLRRISTPYRVISAWMKDGILSYVGQTDSNGNLGPYTFARFDRVDGEWEEQWSTALPASYLVRKQHLMPNPTATEGRILMLTQFAPGESVTDSEGNTWYLNERFKHIELAVDLETGQYTEEWDDRTEFPYVEWEMEDEITTSTGPDGYKKYYVKSGAFTAGVPSTLTVGYYSGYAIGSQPQKKQMPYIGEQFTIGGSLVEVTSCTPIGNVDRAIQDETDVQVINNFTAEEEEIWINPKSLIAPVWKGDYYGDGATIGINWLVIDTDINSVPIDYPDNQQISYKNPTGFIKCTWHRRTARKSMGKLICGVDYDLDGAVVKAFIVSDLYTKWNATQRTWPGGASYYDPDTLTHSWGVGTVPSFWEDPLRPLTFPAYPADGTEDRAQHRLVKSGYSRQQHHEYMVIEGGRNNGARILLTEYQNNQWDDREGSGYEVTGSGSDWNYSGTWDRFFRYVGAAIGTWWDEEWSLDWDQPTFEVVDENQKNAVSEFFLVHCDLRFLTIMGYTKSRLDVLNRNMDIAPGASGYTLQEPESTPGATGAGPPDMTNFNTLAMASGSYVGLNDRELIWLNFGTKAFSNRTGLHGYTNTELNDPAGLDTRIVIDEFGTRQDYRVGVDGAKGYVQETGQPSGGFLSTSMHVSQSGTKKWREYFVHPHGDGRGAVYQDAGALPSMGLDFQATTMGNLYNSWKQQAPVGKENISTSLQHLFGDRDDLLLMWLSDEAVIGGEVKAGPYYSDSESEWVELFFGETRANREYSTEIVYGAKPQKIRHTT